MIEFIDLSKKFGKIKALDSINLTVSNGEIMGLAGINGAGKSTAIKIATGVISPDRGDVLIDGMSILRQRKNAIQNVAWIPEYPILENLDNPHVIFSEFGSMFGYTGEQIKEKSQLALNRVGLLEQYRNHFSSFSNGMKKRFLIGLALFQDPDTYLFDESFSGLDPLGIRLLKDILLELRKEKKSIILSSHILSEIEETADRIAILHHGTIVDISRIRDITSTNNVILKCRNDPEMVKNILKQIGSVRHENDIYRIKVTDNTIENASDLMEYLSGKGLKIESINYGGDTLEAYFIRKIGS